MSRLSSVRRLTLHRVVLSSVILPATFTTFAVVGPANGAPPNATNPSTDVLVTVSGPRSAAPGSTFRAAVTASNVGRSTAEAVTCLVATPRVDVVAEFALDHQSGMVLEPVVGSETRRLAIGDLAPGRSMVVTLTGRVLESASLTDFALTAHCFPEFVDARQTNDFDALSVKIQR